jgi:hypothetical protein
MAEDKRKRKLGFETSANRMEVEFGELMSALTTGGNDWVKTVDSLKKAFNESQTMLEEAKKLKKHEMVEFVLAFQRYLMISQFIGQLGIELTLLHRSVVECEKDIKELKLRIR